MSESPDSNSDRQRKNIIRVITPAYVKIALVTFFTALVAIFIGYWIDRMYHTYPLFIILILVISIPIVFWINLKILRKAIEKNTDVHLRSDKEMKG